MKTKKQAKVATQKSIAGRKIVLKNIQYPICKYVASYIKHVPYKLEPKSMLRWK